jgi:hypothetical protein
MFGLGPRLNTVFKSRWRAASWAGCILLLAYCSMPAVDQVAKLKAKPAAAPIKSPWGY